MRRVVRSSRYERLRLRDFGLSLQQELEESIGAEPERYPLIAETGGFRKARWRRPGAGKNGGVRVIYYLWFAPILCFSQI